MVSTETFVYKRDGDCTDSGMIRIIIAKKAQFPLTERRLPVSGGFQG